MIRDWRVPAQLPHSRAEPRSLFQGPPSHQASSYRTFSGADRCPLFYRSATAMTPNDSSQEKQHGQSSSPKGSSWRAWPSRRRILRFVIAGIAGLSTSWYMRNVDIDSALDYFRPIGKDSYWNYAREEVKDAFIVSWDAYAEHAWGK